MEGNLTHKIYTPCGVTKENVLNGKRAVHLGCGNSKLNGAIGVDIAQFPGVDTIHDLNSFPWPFEDGSVDIFFAHSILEHLDSLPRFFEEVWRVGRSGARIVIAVPYFRSVDAFVDPTHKHFFTSGSLDYFLDKSGNSFSNYNYTEHKFSKIGFWWGWPQPSKNILVRLFKGYVQRNPLIYDQYVSLFAPMKILVWELEVTK